MSFNLVEEPWILVGPRKMGLETLYKSMTDIRMLSGTPIEKIATIRLLLCISQAALDGPEDEEDWLSCKDNIIPSSLSYIKKWKDHFDLYSPEYPFLQFKPLLDNKTSCLSKIIYGRACGNNHTLFDHWASADRLYSPDEIARNLIAFQLFCECGIIGTPTTWDGVAIKGGKQDSIASPLAGKNITVLLGNSLLDTVHFNMVPKDAIREIPKALFGRPIWEYPVESIEKALRQDVLRVSKPKKSLPAETIKREPNEITHSYLGNLIPMSRMVKLYEGEPSLTYTDGMASKIPDFPIYRDPMMTILPPSKEKSSDSGEFGTILKLNLDTQPWREFESILAYHNIEGKSGSGPIAMRHVRNLKNVPVIRVLTGGVAVERAKVLDTAEWLFTIPVGLINSGSTEEINGRTEYFQVYVDTIARTNDIANRLKSSLQAYTHQTLNSNMFEKGEKGGDDVYKRLKNEALTLFWNRVNNIIGELLEMDLTQNASIDSWLNKVRGIARNVYELSCRKERMSAFVKGLLFIM